MAQLSRPQQIALAAVLVLVLGFVALSQLHKSSGEPSSAGSPSATRGSSASASSHAPGPPAATPTLAQAEEKAAAAPTPIYHGAAPGLEGLTRDIARAHGAVATSQEYSKHLEEKSVQAGSQSASASPGATSSAPATGTPSSGTSASNAAPTHTSKAASKHASASKGAPTPTSARKAAPTHTSVSKAAPTHTSVTTTPAASHGGASSQIPSGQKAVEKALAEGKVPLLLFWNPNGADDAAVRGQVRQLGSRRLRIAIYEGNAADVAAYGAITREVPIYGTPTILIVSRTGQTTELTGLQEDFSIEQAIEEARHS
jgi:hypothetical protein